MAESNEQIKQAVAAMKAGRSDEARTILLDIVEKDERNESAWLYLSALVDTLEEQQICLENVLAIDPANEKARKGLQTVSQKLAAQQPGSTGAAPASPLSVGVPTSPAAAPPPPRSAPPGASPFDDSLDWFSAEPETPPAAEPPAFDPFAPATSVDWGRDDQPAAYGSGKQVDLPSAQEYEDWVQGLNLGGEAPAEFPLPSAGGAPESTAPFVPDTAPLFGDTSFMVDSESLAPGDTSAGPKPPDPFAPSAFGAPWESEPLAFSDDSATAAPSSVEEASFPFRGRSSDAEEFASPFASLESEAVSSSSPAIQAAGTDDDLTFTFDDEEDTGDIPDSAPSTAPAAPQAASAAVGAYFRYIPADIETAPGGIGLRSLILLAAVVVLAVLNVVSFAYLLL
jgi:hypothetical protein